MLRACAGVFGTPAAGEAGEIPARSRRRVGRGEAAAFAPSVGMPGAEHTTVYDG